MSMFNLDDLKLDEFLQLKKDGYFTVRGQVLTIHRTGEADVRVICTSPGAANRLRLELADGLAGYVEDGL